MPDQADICQLGLDQRKVNVLAREYCTKIKRKLKPVILSHEMLPGLLEVPHHSAIQNNFVRHFQLSSLLHMHILRRQPLFPTWPLALLTCLHLSFPDSSLMMNA